MQAVGKLTGRTIFITGASRGIGKAIALKCAKDGANVVIAAKTAQPHYKLPGTIYTAAKEIEDAGGKAFPCIVDVQSEDAVKAAVDETVSKFGGIDVLINNASAIHLTPTTDTPMKRYDLMHQINTRGTFLCSKYCIPHLKNGKNPHILNISPPLNMNPRWFKDHVAYTMAKYGMSMCVLGMSEELKPEGIAVNALWPKTAILTAAMEMLGGGDQIKNTCRTVDIMSDAAYVMLNQDSTKYTGNFAIDEQVLKDVGYTDADIDKYNCVPGSEPVLDFFLDEATPEEIRDGLEAGGAKLKFGGTQKSEDAGGAASSGSPVEQTFNVVKGLLGEDMVKKINGTYAFDLKDDGLWHLDLKNGSGSAGKGDLQDAQCRFTMDADSFVKMFQGQLNPTSAFMTGKMKVKGDIGLAMKLEKLMKQAKSKL